MLRLLLLGLRLLMLLVTWLQLSLHLKWLQWLALLLLRLLQLILRCRLMLQLVPVADACCNGPSS
jgi:hypothetical protein